jgi:DNA recombination protein RmuC
LQTVEIEGPGVREDVTDASRRTRSHPTLSIVCEPCGRRPLVRAALSALAGASARLEGMINMLAQGQTKLVDSLNDGQSRFAANLNDRLDSVSTRLGVSLETNKDATTESLKQLAERLAVIDAAQKGMTDLAGQVTSLLGVLANKQSRGAFGQWRMETIVQDNLPQGTYAFQATLSNKTRPDSIIYMPDKRRWSSTPNFRWRR